MADLDVEGFLKSEQTTSDIHYVTKIKIPKFEYDTEAELKEPLKAVGLGGIFADQSISKLFQKKKGRVDSVMQYTKIKMSEEGTKAVAVTAILVKNTALIPDSFETVYKNVYLDRPFAYAIVDDVTGEVIFLGKMVCPSVPEN